MNKLLLVSFILLMLFTLGFADTITNYKVTDSVSINQEVTATGIFDSNAGTLCSFYFFDANTGVLVDRATDQFTTETGRFVMPFFPINEPTFRRGSHYTLSSECGDAVADSNFLVTQRESISYTGQQEFDYLTEPENTDTIFIWGTFLLILLAVVFMLVSVSKYARSK